MNGQTEGLTNPDNAVVGAVEAIAVHPTDSNKLVIGTVNGGLWSTDDAQSPSPAWTPRSDQLSSLSIGAVEYSPSNPNVLYAGTGSFSSGASDGGDAIGVLKSTDGGVSWTQVGGTTLNGKRIRSIVPTSLSGGQVVLVGTYDGGGIFRSTDGGASFTRLTGNGSSGLPANESCTSLRADPSDPTRFFAATIGPGNVGSVWRSTDGGATWTSINSGVSGLATAGRIELAVHGTASTQSLFVAVLKSSTGQPSDVLRSVDAGNTWTGMDLPFTVETSGNIGTNPKVKPVAETDPGSQGRIHFSMVADPTNPNLVYIGGDRQPGPAENVAFPNSIGAVNYSGRLFRGDASKSSGSQWVHLTHSNTRGPTGGGTASGTSPHADSRDLVFDLAGNLMECDDGGIYRRTNPTNNTGDWSAIMGDLQTTEFYSVAYDPLNNFIMGGTQDVGTAVQTQPGNVSWNEIGQGDGGVVQVDSLSTPGSIIRYRSSQVLGGFLRETVDATGTVTNVAGVGLVVAGTGGQRLGQVDSIQFINPYVLNTVDPTRMLIGTFSDIYESMDRGDNLTDLNAFTASYITALAYGGRSGGSANPDVIYAASGSTVRLRTTAGGAFTTLTAYAGNGVLDIALDPNEWKTAYFVDYSGKVWRTRDQGATFTDITNNLGSLTTDLRTIELFENQPGTLQDEVIYVGGLGGVFASINQGTTWLNYGPNLPNMIVKDLRHDTGDNVLLAGTWGRGAWTAPINQAPLNILLSANSVPENTSTLVPLTVGNLALDDDGIGSNILSVSGGSDANKFLLTGNQLQFKAGTVLNFEAKSSYQVTITATDGSLSSSKTFTILLTDENEAPTNITLSTDVLPEQTGTANPLATSLDVGDVTIVDDALGTNVLTISGADANDFQLFGNKLQFKAGTTLDFEIKNQYLINLDSTDGPLVFSKPFTITLTDVNEAPSDITLSNISLPENSSTASPLSIGTLGIIDDALGTNVLSITGGADFSKFQLTGNTLQFQTGTVLDFETQPTFTVDVTSTDTTGPGSPLTFTKTLTVQLTDVNEAAVAITVTPNVIPENTATPVDVGTVAVVNDAIGTSALSPTIGGPDAASFLLVNVIGTTGLLRFAPGVTLNREAKDTYFVDFTAVDTGNTSIQSIKRVAITLSNVNESPTAVNDYMTLAEGGIVTSLVGGAGIVLANDLDPDFYGNLDMHNVTSHTAPLFGLLNLNPNGTFSYQHNGSENLIDSFTYTITDIGGLMSTATVNILITPVNDNAPTAVTDPVNVNEGASVTSVVGGATSLLANDIDIDLPNDTLTFDTTPVTSVIHGSLQLFANGTFQYTHDGSETISDSFQYRIHDALNRESIGTVSITINPVNDNPISRPDTIELPEGGTVTALLNTATSVLANDSDAESPNSALITTVAFPPQHGLLTLNSNGTFSYQHDGSETQTDSFTYQVTDPQNGSSQALVSIRIIPSNDSTPVAINDSAAVQQSGSIFSLIGGAVTVTKNDMDADLPFDSFTVTPMSSPTNGSLSLGADGSFFYTHNGTKTATDSFTYKLTDAIGHVSNTATVNISIKLINEQPVANAGGPYMLAPGTDLILNGAGSNDPDGDSLTYRWDIKGDGIVDATTSSPTVSWATLVSSGLVSGVTNVKLEVRDPSGLSSIATTTLQFGNTYQFSPTADGTPDDYVVSTINGAIDIRKVGTLTNLAPAGLTAVTNVNIVGSSDNETFLVQSPSRTLSFIVDGNNGDDKVKVQGTALADTLAVSSPAGRILVAKTTGTPFYVNSTAETVCVLGSDGNDTLDARQVLATPTSLQLLGENGNDTLTGGLGNEAFIGGNGTDLLSEVGPGNLTLTDTQLTGHGTDTIDATIEAIKLTGDAGGNLLDASAFTRFGVHLDGAAGDDTLLGGSKVDSLIGGIGTDEVRQAVSGNATLSNTLLVLGIAPNSVSDGLLSIERAKLTGSGTVNKLDATNFSGSTTLDGGAANDTLIGGSGADLILGGTENDSLVGNAGNDTIGGGTGSDKIDGGAGNDGLAGQDGNDTITGGTGDDTILGGAGNDSLRGGLGRDLIQGGTGKDNINGEGDVDTVMGGSGGGPDYGDKVYDPIGEVNESFQFTLDWLSLI